jgi:NAD(P)H-dependent flavin oxidoreductase YrpB (nitropropane dioxygenase family)
MGLNAAPAKMPCNGAAQLGLPAGAQGVVLQLREQGGHVLQPARPQRTHLGHQRTSLGHAVFQQFGRWNLVGVVVLAQGQVATLKKSVSASHSLSLLRSSARC